MQKLLVGIVVAAAVLLSACSAPKKDPRQHYAGNGYRVAVEALKCTAKVIGPLGTHGSGVHLDKGRVVTNYHVVDSALEAGKEDEMRLQFSNGKEFAATYVRGNEEEDIAVLKMKGVSSTCSKLAGKHQYPHIMDRVYSAGYPGSAQLTITAGHFQSYDPKYGVLRTTTPIFFGNSGGPIYWVDPVSQELLVLGINSRLETSQGNLGLHLTIAVPAEWIHKYLK